jgi:CheY-like chemotaxis protein
MTLVGRRILVVEDEFLISLATADLLESWGCIVVGPAAGLAAALRIARVEPLDAAILDINLAGQLVWPVAEELQRRNLPFLYLSAYADPGIVPQHISGIVHLTKPLNELHLQRALGILWGGEISP